MKKTFQRNNPRKPNNPHPFDQKPIHSQSPKHKKLLKKIELTQRDAPQYQYEMSLQDNIVFQKPQEEVVDFRVEIEKRYEKAMTNHLYVFPKHKLNNEEMLEDSESSHNSSMESLRHVTVYELASQNKARHKQQTKSIYKTHDEYGKNGRNSNMFLSKESEQRIRTEPDHGADSEQSFEGTPGLPIEVRIRDKNSNTYKKLINMLEKQLNKNTNAMITESRPLYTHKIEEKSNRNEERDNSYRVQKIEPKIAKKDTKENRLSTNLQAKKNMILKDESQRSIGYHISKGRVREADSKLTDKSESAISFQEGIERLRKSTKNLEISQRHKKIQSKEKIGSLLDASNGNAASLVSLDSRVSPSGKKALVDMMRLSQENKKKIYTTTSSTSSLLRALTPKSLAAKNISTILKEKNPNAQNVQKQSNQPENYMMSQTPLSSLYQKVQDDVLNGKFRPSTQKAPKTGMISTTDTSKADKEEIFKGTNFIDFYGSPKIQPQKTSQGSGSLSKTNSAKLRNNRKVEGRTGEKSSERHSGYASYELSSSKSSSKPAFKLDLSTRVPVPKQRDMLSSSRTRDNPSKEKYAERLGLDSLLKASYDMQNHSLIRSSLKQSDVGKIRLGVTPKGNIKKQMLL